MPPPSHLTSAHHFLGRNTFRPGTRSASVPLRPAYQARTRTISNTQTATRRAPPLSTSSKVKFRLAAHSHPLYNTVTLGTSQPAFPRSLPAALRHFHRGYFDSSSNQFGSATKPTKSAFTSWTSVFVAGIIGGSAYLYHSLTTSNDEDEELIDPVEAYISSDHKFHSTMTGERLPGRPGTLTPEQEERLRIFWVAVLDVFGVVDKEHAATLKAAVHGPIQTLSRQATHDSKKEKKKHGWFSRKSKNEEAAGAEADNDKYGQTEQFRVALAEMSPEVLRAAFWSMVKHDHPDGLLLRFLRARKWDVEKALVMMVSTMHWRAKEMHVDDDIVLHGEEHMFLNSQSSDPKVKKWGDDFLAQMTTGKSYIHSEDREGRPLCFVRARLHHAGDQSEESSERYTVHIIETARLLLHPPVDTSCIIFDMTGFSLSNMDYAPVKFMIKAFEANYPESLGIVLIHKAPWVFQGIWKIIRGLLDPVVAAKVNFTNNIEDLSVFIDPEKLPKEQGGLDDWVFEYILPTIGENGVMKDEGAKQKILDERQKIVDGYEKNLIAWIEHSGDRKIIDEKQALRDQLKANYWKLDPYVRARTSYDRAGNLGPNGEVNWNPTPQKVAAAASTAAPVPAPNGHVVQTSADDLD